MELWNLCLEVTHTVRNTYFFLHRQCLSSNHHFLQGDPLSESLSHRNFRLHPDQNLTEIVAQPASLCA